MIGVEERERERERSEEANYAPSYTFRGPWGGD